jgi:hypothetical protein
VLAIDEASAEVVRRIFAEYLAGQGDRAIASGLNRDGVPCPSARRPDQNRHRLPDGWQGSTVRSILENPRYTGYAFFGRWTRHEMLLDPDDVAAGHVVRFRRANPDRVVRSRQPAHPAIVSVEDFTQAQLLRRSKAAGGLATARKADRGGRATARDYLLRGLMRCGICSRQMQGATIRRGTYYRCTARTLAPGASALANHPATVNMREDVVLKSLNGWIGSLFSAENIDETVAALVASQSDTGAPAARSAGEAVRARRAECWIGGLFDRKNRDQTVAALFASQGGDRDTDAREAIEKWLCEAETRLRRLRQAIEAGVDPTAVVEAINEAQAQRAAARAELKAAGQAPSLCRTPRCTR